MDQYFNDMDLDIDLDMDMDMDMKGLDDDDLYDDLYDRGDEEIGDTGTFTGDSGIRSGISAWHPSESGSLEWPLFHPDGKLSMPGQGCSSPWYFRCSITAGKLQTNQNSIYCTVPRHVPVI